MSMSTIYCMNCGAELEKGARFCTECGSPTTLGLEMGLAAPDAENAVACPSCGVLNNGENTLCGACGATLHPVHEHKAVATPAVSAKSAPRKEKKSKTAAFKLWFARLKERLASLDRRRVLTVAGVAVAIVAVIGLGYGISGLLGGGSAAPDEAAEEAVEEEPATGVSGVEVRDGLNSYSWSELSTIAKALSALESREDALALAQEYHLVDDKQHMMTATKEISIEGYGKVAMRLVDVYHDDLAEGEGKAGLTFVAASLPVMRQMNTESTSEGGWEKSELRSWLGDKVYKALDEELRSSIVAVSKKTNNKGYATDKSCVTTTSDYLWLPSLVELMGPIDWSWNSDPENSENFNAITNAEGSQYALFKEHDVQNLEAGDLMQLKNGDDIQPWWERSCVQSNYEYFRAVGYEGDPTNIWWADDAEVGVPISFCL